MEGGREELRHCSRKGVKFDKYEESGEGRKDGRSHVHTNMRAYAHITHNAHTHTRTHTHTQTHTHTHVSMYLVCMYVYIRMYVRYIRMQMSRSHLLLPSITRIPLKLRPSQNGPRSSYFRSTRITVSTQQPQGESKVAKERPLMVRSALQGGNCRGQGRLC
jgi:hypothetical protein